MTPAEKQQLKSLEILLAYGEKTLGPPTRTGGETLFPCPFGNHNRPHLAIRQENGTGLYKCRACDKGGDIFTLAAHLMNADLKRDFPKIAQNIAETTGITLSRGNYTSQEPKTRGRGRKMRPQRKPITLPPEAPATRFISAENETTVRAWMKRTASNPPELAPLAEELGLPAPFLASLAAYPAGGSVALTPDNRLAYIYTAEDTAGKLRVTCVKLRIRRNGQPMPCAYLNSGKYNPSTQTTEARFAYIAANGKREDGSNICAPSAPYGMQAAIRSRHIIITEGESDALAVKASMEAYAEATGTDLNQWPAIVGIAGVSNLKDEFLPFFRGKHVLLCLDADEAGQNKRPALLATLNQHAFTVRSYTPPDKDMRATYRKTPPAWLAEELIKTYLFTPYYQ